MKKIHILLILVMTLPLLLAQPASAEILFEEDFSNAGNAIEHSDNELNYVDYAANPEKWHTCQSFGWKWAIKSSGGVDNSPWAQKNNYKQLACSSIWRVVHDQKQTKGQVALSFDYRFEDVANEGPELFGVTVWGIKDGGTSEWAGFADVYGGQGGDWANLSEASNYTGDDGTQLLLVSSLDTGSPFVAGSRDFQNISLTANLGSGYDWILVGFIQGNLDTDADGDHCGVDNVVLETASGPTPLNPADGDINIASPVDLQWTFTGDAYVTKYTLYVSDDERAPTDPNFPATYHTLLVNGAEVLPATPDPYVIPTYPTAPQSDPNGTYNFSPVAQNTTYYWKVITDVLDPNTAHGGLGGIDPNDPIYMNENTVDGPVWSFTGIIPIPEITLEPVDQFLLPDKNFLQLPTTETREFVVEISHGLPLSSVTWYKDGSPVVLDADHVVTDELLNSTNTRSTLSIHNVSEADEGQYYAVAAISSSTDTSESAGLYVSSKILAHRWTFDNTLEDSVNPGSAYAAVIVDPNPDITPDNIVLGSSYIYFDPASTLDGANTNTADPNAHYVDLPNGVISEQGDTCTIAIWYTFEDPDQEVSFVSLLDAGSNAAGEEDVFGGGGERLDLLAINGSLDSIDFRFEEPQYRVLGGTDSGLPDPAMRCVIVVWDGITDTLQLFVDGELAETNNGAYEDMLADIVDVNVWLGRRQVDGKVFQGKIHDLQIYDVALSPEYAQSLYEAGPDGDDARNLNPCLVDFAPSAQYDLNGDCVVDLADFSGFAQSWLKCGLLECP